MKNIFFILVLISQLCISQTREISGTVTFEKLPLPGASITVKGTEITTSTDFDGEFRIKVPDSLNIIVISYLGFVTKEIDVSKDFDNNGEYVLEEKIYLEEQVIVCYSYPHRIGVSYYGGLNNSGLGFIIEYFDPYTFKLPFVPEIKLGYQTNSLDNYQIMGEFNLKDLFRIGRNTFHVDFSFRDIDIIDNFNWESIKLEAETYFRIFNISSTLVSLGLGKSTLNSNTSYGLTAGLEQYLFKGIRVNLQTTKWKGFWQLQTGLKWRYRNFSTFYELNLINNYIEHNVGLGYYINI